MTYVEQAKAIVDKLEQLTEQHAAQLDAMQRGGTVDPPVVIVGGNRILLSQLPQPVIEQLLVATHRTVITENIQQWYQLQQLAAVVIQQLQAVDKPAAQQQPPVVSNQQPVQFGQSIASNMGVDRPYRTNPV